MAWVKTKYPGKSHCGGRGAIVNGTQIEWARSSTQLQSYLRGVEQTFGVFPELVLPTLRINKDDSADSRVRHALGTRWSVTESFLADARRGANRLNANETSLLDVGGIGTYSSQIARYACINTEDNNRCSRYLPGDSLPYSSNTFDVVLAESTLHHVAENTVPLLREMTRVSDHGVIIIEDIMERSASKDVAEAYRSHDAHASYRSLSEWIELARLNGLRLTRLAFLHRVPIHVKFWATACELGFAPMAYMLFEKQSKRPAAIGLNDPGGTTAQQPSMMGSVELWRASRRREEQAAGMTCQCNRRRCSVCVAPKKAMGEDALWWRKPLAKWESTSKSVFVG